MKIILRMNNINYDITSIVDTNNLHKEIEMEFTTEGTFNTSSFIIPSVEKYELGPNIDFSRGIIRNCLVTIERDGIEYQWRVMADSMVANPNGTFTHNVQLIDRRSETTGINIPGLTLTQSKSEQGSFIRSIHSINRSNYIGNYWYNGGTVTMNNSSNLGINMISSNSTVPQQLVIQSADTTVIQGLTLKDTTKTYTISLSMTLVNTQVNYERSISGGGYTYKVKYSDAVIPYTIKIMAGSTVLSTETSSINPATLATWNQSTLEPTAVNLITKQYSKTVSFTPTAETTISVIIEVNGNYVKYVDPYIGPPVTSTQSDSLSINALNLNIYTPTVADPSRKSLNDWMNRILTNIFIGETPLYTLSSSSASRLSDMTAPEFSIDGYNLYQAIQEVADFLGASWQILPNNEIDFIFFDDTTIIDINEDQKQILTAVSDLNDYASSVQLNVENVASNTIKKERNLTVRATTDSAAQITTDNVMIKTEEPINYKSKVVFKGISLTLDGTPTNPAEGSDISNRIFTKEEWDILPSQFDKSTTGRNSFNKNNTLYFIRGQKGLHGLSYVGGVEPRFIGSNNINRSLFETIAATAYQATGQSASNKDEGISTQNDLKVDIDYFPFTSSDVHIYKDDQQGFQIERHKYFNESSRVNDPELLGKVAQNNINRLGGTEYTTTGYLETVENLPRLGTLNSQGRRLTKIILQLTDSYIRYTATYIADYTKISKFVGKKSDYRLYEIPNTAVIESNRIKRNRILFGSTTTGDSIFSSYVKTLENTKISTPILAKLDFTHSIGTSTVYTTVSSNEFGKSASWKVKALNNFSFGVKKISRTVESETVWFQEEVKYTDNLGRVDDFSITYYSAYTAGDNYPAGVLTSTSLIGAQSFTYDKDARETFSFEYETSFGSTNIDKYRIYDGITKFNSFINGRSDYVIECRVLDYIPNRNDIKVDLTRTKALSTVSVGSSSITVNSSTTGIGIVFYEKNSQELLLVIKDSISIGNYTIPFGLPEPLVFRTVTFNTNGGSFVPNQTVLNGTYLIEPIPTRTGYNFDAWYTEPEFLDEFNFNTPITSNLVLYARWIPQADQSWQQIFTTIFDEALYPQIESYTCPTDYTPYLPNANNYELNHTISIRPIRWCNPESEFCLLDPNDNPFIFCETRYYKVIQE